MTTKILCVDDDANILAAFQRNLRKQFTLEIALSGEEALAALNAKGPYAVLVADMQMPGMNGVQLLTRAGEQWPDTVRVMLTGNADRDTAIEAVNQGHIFRFLTKPCPPERLAVTLAAGLQQYRLVTAERELLEKTLSGSVRLLTDLLSVTDPTSFGQGQALKEYVRAFARELKISQTWDLEVAALLCRIGCVTIPAPLLAKAREGGAVTACEAELLARVPEIGARLLANIPRLETVSRIVLYQDKHYDGSGFPSDHVAGQDLPIGARILKVLADLSGLEASGRPRFKALEEMHQRRGWYDPTVLEAAFVCFDVSLPEGEHPRSKERSLRANELRVGQQFLTEVRTTDGMLIVTAGTTISPVLLERLHNFASVTGLQEPLHVCE